MTNTPDEWRESVEIDPPFLSENNEGGVEHSLLHLHTNTRKHELPKLQQSELSERIQGLLHSTSNAHLKNGLGILAGLMESMGNDFRADQLDGPQILTDTLCSYIKEHLDELMSHIQNQKNQLSLDLECFMNHEKHQHADQKTLALMYLTQLAHIAFHLSYHGYESTNYLNLPDPSQPKSAIIMTTFGSLITVTTTSTGLEANYLRLAIRDHQDPPKALSIHTGKIPHLVAYQDHSIDVSPYRIGNYGRFSPNRVIAINKRSMPRYETTWLTASLTSISRILTRKEVERALKSS